MTRTTSIATPVSASELVTLLERQRDLFQQLGGLGQLQRQAAEAGSVSDLLTVLTRRQGIINQLSAVNEALAPCRARTPESWGWTSEAQRQQARDLLEGIRGLHAGILEQDQRITEQLQAARGQLSAELQRLSSGGAVAAAYRGAGAGTAAATAGRFTNRQG